MSEYLDWDSTISSDSEYTLLENGDYNYTVTNLEKTYTQKTGAPMAKVTLKVYDEANETSIIDNLVLQQNCEWKLSQFFRSIGQKKHGEPYRMDWSKVVGSTGRCKVKNETFTNQDGKEIKTNRIERYYDPLPEAVKAAEKDDAVPWA